jgi:hypothetical protein
MGDTADAIFFASYVMIAVGYGMLNIQLYSCVRNSQVKTKTTS